MAELTREGSALLAEGSLDQALDRFRAALRLRPSDPALEFNVGLTLFRMGRFEESLEPLERATGHPPSAPNARFLRGIAHFQAERFAAAARELEAVRSHGQFGEQALYMLTESYRKSGDTDRSQGAFVELERRFPGSAFYHKLLGTAYDSEGLLEDALREFRAALAKDPAMPEVAFAIGFVLYKQRDHEQAATWLAKELAVQPCYAKAHFYLAEIAAAASEAPAAESRYRQALACDAGYAAAHAGLGALHARQRNYDEALPALRTAVSMDPDNAEALYSLGQVLLRLGRKSEAEAAFDAVDAIHAAKHETAKRALSGTGADP